MGAHHKFSGISDLMATQLDKDWESKIKTLTVGEIVNVSFEKSIGGGGSELHFMEMQILEIKSPCVRLMIVGGVKKLLLRHSGLGRIYKLDE